jgi:hypothetical protein
MREERLFIEMVRKFSGSVLRVPVPEEIEAVLSDDDADDDMVDMVMKDLVHWYTDEFMEDGWQAVKVFGEVIN